MRVFLCPKFCKFNKNQQPRIVIDSFLEYLSLEKKYSVHTITAYKNDLISFKDFLVTEFKQENLSEVHYNQIRTWIVSLVDLKISNRSINRKVSSLKSFYKFLQKTHQIKVNPLAKHKALKINKKVQIPFNQKEINQVINTINEKDDFISIRNKLIVELFYSTGVRRAELINVKENDIDLSNKIIKVLGKRNKQRYIPLLPSVIQTLKQYLEAKKKISAGINELFITEKGNKIYETLVYRIINSYFSKVSTKQKKSPHILRHSFATHLLNEGANINSVKELLGHSSLASTQVYTHNSLDAIKKVYNQAHPRSNKNKKV
ncbi:tyrosine-type recombinase/integrase [Polaribacter sp. M15]